MYFYVAVIFVFDVESFSYIFFLCCHASNSNLSKVLAGFDMTNLGSRTFFPLTILFWRYIFVEEYFQKCGESTLLINKSKADLLCYRNVMVLHR